MVQQQAKEIFYSFLLMSEGQFFFYREEMPENVKTRFFLSTQNLLMEGMQRIDEMSYFRESIPSSQVVFERIIPKGTPVPIKDPEKRVLGLTDGVRTTAFGP